MAVLKLSKSKNQVQVIDDDGNMFVTSIQYLDSLRMGTLKSGFILMSKFPFKVNNSRFKESPVWIPPSMDKAYVEEQLKRQKEGLSTIDATTKKGRAEQKQAEVYGEDSW